MTVLINADDFGMYDSANRGILYSLEHNLINSVSICVNYKSDQNLNEIMRYRDRLVSIGLHINMTEGKSLDSLSLYSAKKSHDYFYQGIDSQIKIFVKTLGFLPEHMDCHQHYVYFDENAYHAYIKLARKYKIPIRSPEVFSKKEGLSDFFETVKKRYGIDIPFDQEKIISMLNTVKLDQDLYRTKSVKLSMIDFSRDDQKDIEVVCHPQMTEKDERNNELIILSCLNH